MSTLTGTTELVRGRVRFGIVAMLLAVNYADRATIAIAGSVMSKDLGFSPVQMGFIFSAFGWFYVIGQLPGGWPDVFYFMGAAGVLISFIWLKVIYGPKDHPRLRAEEFGYMEPGSALVNMDQPKDANASHTVDGTASPLRGYLKHLLQNRMMIGIYLGQALKMPQAAVLAGTL